MSPIAINKIANITIIALASDDKLVESLVLKGGNALGLTLDDSFTRASYDIDYSIIDGDFKEEFLKIEERIKNALLVTFSENNYVVFDCKLQNKPKTVSKEQKDFWGGYRFEFKIIDRERYLQIGSDLERIRREAIVVQPDNSTKIELEFSKHEYVDEKQKFDIDGYSIFIYTPAMILFEKLRAICQQFPEYRNFVKSHAPSPRPKDFYDIFMIDQRFDVDMAKQSNIELRSKIFSSKKVPVDYVELIKNFQDFHANRWVDVENTVSSDVVLMPFDFYFDYVVSKYGRL